MIPYTEDSPHFFRQQENTTSHKFQRLSQMAKNEQNVLMAKADPPKKNRGTQISKYASFLLVILYPDT